MSDALSIRKFDLSNRKNDTITNKLEMLHIKISVFEKYSLSRFIIFFLQKNKASAYTSSKT